MAEQPRVSIITPSFNQGAFLEQTILSVLNQNYPNLEYWLIDAGSTDDSLEIIKKYKDRLSGWVSEPDRGQADGINKGFTKASGDIVAWLNSDDVYAPNAIQEAVEAFQRFPEASFVFSEVESIDENGEPFNLMHYGDWKLKDLMTFKIIGQPGVFMRREVLEEAGYLDLSFNYLLDVQLWLKMAVIAEPQYIPDKLWARARMHQDAKNMAAAEKFGPEAFRLAKWLCEDPRFYPLSAEIFNQVWAGAHHLNAFYLVEAGKYKEGIKAYGQMLRYQPFPSFKTLKRMFFALFSLLGLKNMRRIYDKSRKERYSRKEQ